MAESSNLTEGDQTPELWTAAQHEAALAHVAELQDRIDRLRNAIPSVVAPLAQPQIGRISMFARVKKAALQSNDDLKSLRESWNSEQTQALLARSKASQQKDGDLSKAKDIPKYGWSGN